MPINKPITDERFVLKALHEEGWEGDGEALRILADEGEQLRQRYENACNYRWATTDTYAADTEAMERAVCRYAEANGLTIYLQTDCRGATVYVRDKSERIDDNRYSTQAQCLYYARGE